MSVEPTEQEQEEQLGSSTSISAQEWVAFAVGAARRHPLLGGCMALVIAIVGVAVALALPPVFEASGRILVTQQGAVTQELSNPSRPTPNVDPMRGVSDIVMKKENLEGIVRDANLLQKWDATRAPHLRLKDKLMAALSGPVPDFEKVKALGNLVEARLVLRAEDSSHIRISATWGDPNLAQTIARLAQRKFLDLRGGQETAAITAAIDILEDELKRAADAIEPELEAVVRAQKKGRSPQEKGDAGTPPQDGGSAGPQMQFVRPAPVKAVPNAGLGAKLADIRQKQREIQDPWQRRLTELRLQLGDLKGQYGPAHPGVVQQEARIRDASVEPAELADLRKQEADLLGQIESGSLGESSPGSGRWVPRIGGTAAPSTPQVIVDEDPAVAAARAKLNSAITKYGALKERLDAARLELTSAEIAFKFRYVVVAEPELPQKPVKPNRAMLILASIGAALLIGFLSGGVKELISGRVIEPFQVKQLGIPLLAEVNLTEKSES
jgi:uncharacterized protein involved in exopolysaccharide biosynthesis